MGPFNTSSTSLFNTVNWPTQTSTPQTTAFTSITNGSGTNQQTQQTQQSQQTQVSAPVTAASVNVTHPNGLIELNQYTAAGKVLIECETPSGVKVWINGGAGGVDPASIPSDVVGEMNTNPRPVLVDGIDGAGNSSATLINMIIPNSIDMSQDNSHDLLLANGGGAEWYNYRFMFGHYESPYRNTSYGNTAWNGTDMPPQGYGRVYPSAGAPITLSGGNVVTQTFNSLAQAQAYVANHPGSTINPVNTLYPNGSISPSQYPALQSQGWNIFNTSYTPFLSGIPHSQASQYLNNPDYRVTPTGVITGGTSDQNWNDINQTTLNALIAQYAGNPNFTYQQDGTFGGTSGQNWNDLTQSQVDALIAQYGPGVLTVKDDGNFPGTQDLKTGIVVGSAQYNQLIADGYHVVKTYGGNGTNHTVTLASGLTEAEANAILAQNPGAKKVPDGTKIIKSYKDVSKTVSLTGLTKDQLTQYMSKPGYKVVGEHTNTTGSHTVTKYYNNPVVGAMFEVLNSADNDGNLTSAELNSIFKDNKYAVSSLDDDGTLQDGTTVVTDGKNCDDHDGYLAGDPGVGTDDNNYAWTDVDPGNNKTIAIAKNTSQGHFSFQLNGKTGDINGNAASGTSFTEYQYNLSTSDGKKTKVHFNDGMITITSNAGTANESVQTIDPTVSGSLPWQLNDPESGKPVFKLEIKDVAGAGEGGSSEKRVVATAISLPEKSVMDDLIAQGVSIESIYDKAGKVETSFAARAITSEGGSAYGHSLGGAGLKDSLYNGIEDYYDIHIGEEESVSFSHTVNECEKVYDIEFCDTVQEEVCTEVPTYKVVKEECTEEQLADLSKEVPGEKKFDVCLPGTPGEPKYDAHLKGEPGCELYDVEEIWYDLDKTEYEVTSQSNLAAYCYTAGAQSPFVVDLNGDGKVIDYSRTMGVDMDGSGVKKQVAAVQYGDGLMGIDFNKDGKIDKITEMLGNKFNGTDYVDARYALRSFVEQNLMSVADDDPDTLNATEIAKLDELGMRVQVYNPDGTTSLKTLTEAGIQSFSLVVKDGFVPYSENGVYYNPAVDVNVNGKMVSALDVWWLENRGTLPPASQQGGQPLPATTTNNQTTNATNASSNTTSAYTAQDQINASIQKAIQDALMKQFQAGQHTAPYNQPQQAQPMSIDPMVYMTQQAQQAAMMNNMMGYPSYGMMNGGFGGASMAQFQQYMLMSLMLQQLFSGGMGGFNPFLWQGPRQ